MVIEDAIKGHGAGFISPIHRIFNFFKNTQRVRLYSNIHNARNKLFGTLHQCLDF